MKTAEFDLKQITQAIHEYSERRGLPLRSVILVAQSRTSAVPDVVISAQGIVLEKEPEAVDPHRLGVSEAMALAEKVLDGLTAEVPTTGRKSVARAMRDGQVAGVKVLVEALIEAGAFAR